MLFPIVMLSLCAIGGVAFFILNKILGRRAPDEMSLSEKTANEFVNVRDIKGNLLFTLDGMALCFIKVTLISVDLFSKNEKKVLMRTLTAEMSSFQHEFQFLAVSRPVDISPVIAHLMDLHSTADNLKQKELLKREIEEMNSYATSGDVVERQFFFCLWDKAREDVERELLPKAKQLVTCFEDSSISCELLGQHEIVQLCNFINNPAYIHLEDSDTQPTIPIISMQ